MGESGAGGKRRAKRRHKPSRVITSNQVVPPPSSISIKARVNPSEHDYMVFLALGDYLTPLRNRDLVAALHGVEWDDRRNILTPLCSARWAGTITRDNNDLIALAIRNRDAEIADKRRTIAVIEARLAQPIPEKKEKGEPSSVPAPDEGADADGGINDPDGALAGKRSRAGKSKVVGCSSQDERAAKLLRLYRLRADLAAVERDAATGHLHICRGTAALLRKRLHLDEAHITEERWRDEWTADRRYINANGESGKNLGNETIRLDAKGRLYIDLPPALVHLANAKDHRYILDATAVFHYRADEWLTQVAAKKAVSYSLDEDGAAGRWYLTASWTRKPEKGSAAGVEMAPKATTASARHRTLGIDLNADHIACVVTDEHGNPVGTPLNIRLELKGLPTSTRDGHIRHIIIEALRYSRHLGATHVSIENLGFADSKGRELFGHNRKFRAAISGFPTAQFCQRISAMSARAGMVLIAVDPAYTSQWGKEHWVSRLSTPKRRATTHEGAAAVIARREQGCRARIALGKRTGEQSIQAGAGARSRKRVPVAAGLRLPVARQAQMEIVSGKAPNGRPGTKLKSRGETGSSHRVREPIPQGEDRALPPRLFTPPDRSSGVGFVRF